MPKRFIYTIIFLAILMIVGGKIYFNQAQTNPYHSMSFLTQATKLVYDDVIQDSMEKFVQRTVTDKQLKDDLTAYAMNVKADWRRVVNIENPLAEPKMSWIVGVHFYDSAENLLGAVMIRRNRDGTTWQLIVGDDNWEAPVTEEELRKFKADLRALVIDNETNL
jgi:hypothetical protein